MESMDHEYFTIRLVDGIIHFIYKPNLKVSLEMAIKMVNARCEFSNNIRRPILLDVRNLVSIDIKARKYLATEEASRLLTAGAVLLDNPLTKFAGNIFLKIDTPAIPTRLFTEQQAALLWLEKFKNLN
ncbi:MAG: hypothetical protein MUF42_17250 [Cytophagaceae bacterium]|jgi:hypothetical protein|nr:hypothetical protein [Cytophagaceae bacterium]